MWKPCGMTSNDFATHAKIQLQCKRLCFAGRLDPLAQGVMMLLTDDDVSEMNVHLLHNKVYEFKLIIGISTESLDLAGKITNICPPSAEHTAEYFKETFHRFIETYDTQRYPLVSSFVVKLGAVRKPLWWFAKHNIPVEVPIKQVRIHEYDIGVIESVPIDKFIECSLSRLDTVVNEKTRYDLQTDVLKNQYVSVLDNIRYNLHPNNPNYPNNPNLVCISIKLDVTTGFYVRQFCEDFGKHIGYPCIAFDITRTAIYPNQFIPQSSM